ncbi:ABC transporter ATP-binding protein [Microbaculum marinisediminis]|uniref:ABC transporter ATP-binding protein n=1 Tax=Microbaculum marinisediminis TaxID=2931392 RepID=A0AAW5R5D1_9HYPH|nr:ABC transporter ATP-binding protein [Microbaculum sp. A6E488]MCT8974587.1 ABC transporter ATP-binding protein [Microbaculum sp. A6E488]
MLEIQNLTSGYAGMPVLKNLSLTVETGSIVVVLGANGAGKTTLMNTISGLVRPMSGHLLMEGRPLAGLAAEDVVAAGISHVPQGRRVFPGLTVGENLIVAVTAATKRAPGGFDQALEEVYELFPRLKERRNQLGWSLSGGEQQMLAVGRAIVARPKLILLDEPSLGLAPLIFQSMFDAIAELNRRDGTTFLVVEQNAEQALRIGHRAYVMELGELVAEGSTAEIARDPAIEKAYLGA